MVAQSITARELDTIAVEGRNVYYFRNFAAFQKNNYRFVRVHAESVFKFKLPISVLAYLTCGYCEHIISNWKETSDGDAEKTEKFAKEAPTMPTNSAGPAPTLVRWQAATSKGEPSTMSRYITFIIDLSVTDRVGCNRTHQFGRRSCLIGTRFPRNGKTTSIENPFWTRNGMTGRAVFSETSKTRA